MQKIPRLALLILVGILSLGLGSAQQATGPNQQIDELWQQWVELYNQGDVAAMSELYTEDTLAYTAFGSIVEGRQAVQEALQGVLDLGAAAVELEPRETTVMGDTAYDLGSYTFLSEDGQTVVQGNYMNILQRVNGNWQIHRQVVNMLLPEMGPGQETGGGETGGGETGGGETGGG